MPALVASDEDTIKVATEKRKDGKKEGGPIKLKRAAPKLNKAGNWMDGAVADGLSFTCASYSRRLELG